ncbi:MAG TPA: sulfite exporter TauE/SafE family protein [Pseudolabrys sp.]|nr:sulfite exporter TauE/SafE family protein [Pseudolabrys sp.]
MSALLSDHAVSPLGIDLGYIITLLSIFAGSLAAGLAGFAFSAIAGALLFHWLAPVEAVPLLLACSVTTQLFSITSLWSTMQWRQCLPYLVGGVAGIPLGAKLLENFSPHVFAGGFGIFLICYSSYMLLRPALAVSCGGRLAEVAAGFAGGITGGATAFPGAFPTIWCSLRGLSKNEQRGIVQPFILLMQIATLVYFSKLGIFSSGTWTNYFWCVPAVIAGTWLGLQLFDRVDDKKFRRLVLFFLLVSGTTLVV